MALGLKSEKKLLDEIRIIKRKMKEKVYHKHFDQIRRKQNERNKKNKNKNYSKIKSNIYFIFII